MNGDWREEWERELYPQHNSPKPVPLTFGEKVFAWAILIAGASFFGYLLHSCGVAL